VRKQVLSDPLRAIFPSVALERLVNEHASGAREHTWKLWSLLTLALWLETFSVEVPGVSRPLEVI
jgi:hypothetical protein